ncbi:DUF2330 domain-containing protein [Flaviaesturariibacter amylovorans]|uniref:DUF2330 domain-containing protein n=1 Tax=Flaviaesturariibacter amylovorans TaxID=1084520 RepID=A0ABP8HMC6_9BACT
MKRLPSLDPRWFQAGFQLLFLLYGLFWLGWRIPAFHLAISIGGCGLLQWAFESIRQRRPIPLRGAQGFGSWGFSVLISALSLCLLLRCNSPLTSALAAFCTVGSKYVFRVRGRHFFNPSAFGIVAVLLFSGDAWLSPAQWGSNAVLFFFLLTLGTIVVTRVQKLDVSLAFLLAFAGLTAWRQLGVLGWPADHFAHTLATGSLLLFTFFMISDPRSTPAHPLARIAFGIIVGAGAFYLSAYRWWYNTPLLVLVAAAPLVPLFDRLYPAAGFEWRATALRFPAVAWLLRLRIPTGLRKGAIVLIGLGLGLQALAFCGFYVSKADGTLKNKTSQVIMVRDGERNSITMYNDFKGDFKDFAMVVPVPVVLQKSDIRVVDPGIFTRLNDYSKPRLVEYFDQDPCRRYDLEETVVTSMGVRRRSADATKSTGRVKIEAQYVVGEYDILILSAQESAGLRTWLDENGYHIPEGAEEVLEPYIKSNLKFFVVKVNEKELKKIQNNFLRPIQIEFSSPKFMLPIRLGMANADGDQDLLVYALSRKGRVECTNYRTVPMPTGQTIPEFVQQDFGRFYAKAFERRWEREGRALGLLEYAWDVSPSNYVKCDPCVSEAPAAHDLVQAGVWWISPRRGAPPEGNDNVHFTRLHFRYNRRSFPQDLIFQVTPNKEPFQARYVLTHPAKGPFQCADSTNYLETVRKRRAEELKHLGELTGTSYRDWSALDKTDPRPAPDASYAAVSKSAQRRNGGLLRWLGW